MLNYVSIHIDLRLNNETNGAGLLDYYNTSGWIPVCFTETFNEYAADVTCRQLGYPFGVNFSSVALPNDRPGIVISRSFCEGASSSYLFNCVEFANSICQTQLHLICYNSRYFIKHYITNKWNIILGSNTVRLIGGPVENIGRVEVFDRTSNQWGTICYNDVSRNQHELARIICKSLGYYSYYIYGTANNFPSIASSSNSPIITGRIRCPYTPYVYQNVYQCSDFELHLGMSISRCTSNQEWMVICTCKFLYVCICL